MPSAVEILRQIENLNTNQLAEALKFNGYGECVGAIYSKSIDGQGFLKLTEVQISLWRLPLTHSRRLWSFLQQIKADPSQLLLKTDTMPFSMTDLNKSAASNPLASNHLNTLKKKPSVSTKPDISKVKRFTDFKQKETNSSTLTKQESNTLKNRLEQVLKSESTDTPTSFLYHQTLKLPPKPNHLTVDISKTNEVFEEYSSDGYLSPINVDLSVQHHNNEQSNNFHRKDNLLHSNDLRESHNSEESTNEIRSMINNLPLPATSTFLGKFKKNYEHLEKRPEVVENAYEGRKNKSKKLSVHDRPLPPLPISTVDNRIPGNEISNWETSVSDCEEYIEVVDDNGDNHKPVRRNNFKHTVKPPLPPPSQKFNKMESQLETPKSQTDLPKPPANLPTSILDLPSLSMELKQINLHETSSSIKLPQDTSSRPLPPIPTETKDILEEVGESQEIPEETLSYYSKVDLISEPCYREIDRAGARQLLEGLEDGAFVIRPSRNEKFLCSLSIKHNIKMFNVGVIKQKNGAIILESEFEQPEFYDISDMVSYYCNNPMPLSGKYVFLKTVLSSNKY